MRRQYIPPSSGYIAAMTAQIPKIMIEGSAENRSALLVEKLVQHFKPIIPSAMLQKLNKFIDSNKL